MPLRKSPAAPATLLACALVVAVAACRPQESARASWDAVRLAAPGADQEAAAKALSQLATPEVAAVVQDHLGAFEGSDARAYLAALVARHRPEGAHWLARRVFGGQTLEDAFADLLDPSAVAEDEEARAPLDWPVLVDALATVLPDDPGAAKWLALLALGDRGESTEEVRRRIADHTPVRGLVRAALDDRALPKTLPAPLFAAFAAPADEVEAAWLRGRYRLALSASLDDRSALDFEGFSSLRDAFAEAFPDEELPLDADDRTLATTLSAPDDDAPAQADADGPPPPAGPSFADVASFLTRHRRTGWLPVVQRFAARAALPPNALALVCRFSAAECSDVLREQLEGLAPAAADVAPALDLPGGDETLATACDLLQPPEARALAGRGAGAGMPVAVRESAVNCLTLMDTDEPPVAAEVLAQAVGEGRWDVANRLGMNHHGLVSPPQQEAAIQAAEAGTVGLADVEGLLLDDDVGTALRDRLAREREARPRRPGCGLPGKPVVLDEPIVD